MIAQYHIDPIWFGCLFGLLLFVMKGVAPHETTMATIVAAALPFVAIMIVVLIMVMLVPELATWMPSLVAR